jgi:hypothetical protein
MSADGEEQPLFKRGLKPGQGWGFKEIRYHRVLKILSIISRHERALSRKAVPGRAVRYPAARHLRARGGGRSTAQECPDRVRMPPTRLAEIEV